MKTLILAAIRCSLMFTAVAALSLAYPASVQAVPTTYQYTGNPFTEVHGVYTTSDFVTVMLTLPHALQANSPFHEVHPTAFTFSDGVTTIDNNDFLTASFFFATSGGQIVAWQLTVNEIVAFPFIRTEHQFIFTFDDGAISSENFGFNTGNPGTWSGRIVAPDAGSTLSLMTLTLMALGLVARRFQRAAG